MTCICNTLIILSNFILGEPIKPPVIRGKTLMHLRSSEESSAVESGDGEGGDDDEYEYTSSEEIDVTCAPGKGWHHRGPMRPHIRRD